jgi:hypothetical protein
MKRRELLASKKRLRNRHFWQKMCQSSVQLDTWIRQSFPSHSITASRIAFAVMR